MTATVHDRARYVHKGCRCVVCRRANTVYVSATKRRGYPARVGAARARRHALQLAEIGIGKRQLAIVSGVSESTIQRLLGRVGYSPSKRISPKTERAILGVTSRDMAASVTVPKAKTEAQLQTLLDRGWTRTAVGRRISGPNARPLYLQGVRVTVRVARVIESLLDECVGDFDPVAERLFLQQQAALSVDDRAAERRSDLRKQDQSPPAEPLPTTWMLDGACRTREIPTWVFFPGRGDSAMLRSALRICNACPVIVECGDWERANPQLGVWAGKSEKERKRRNR